MAREGHKEVRDPARHTGQQRLIPSELALQSRPEPAGRRAARKRLTIAGTTLAALVVSIGGTLLVLRPWESRTSSATLPTSAGSATEDPGPQSTVPVPQVASATAFAACVSASSKDGGGNPTSYEPSRAVDGVTTTAWRCAGDGIGQQLQIRFDRTVALSRIGLIPGLAKTDQYDLTDRYAQNRRISAVQYDFDDGSTVYQNFDVADTSRSVQSIPLNVVETSAVTVTIKNSVPGSRQNGNAAVNTVAISEVIFS